MCLGFERGVTILFFFFLVVAASLSAILPHALPAFWFLALFPWAACAVYILILPLHFFSK
jgi:hypothetical protein